MEPVDTETVKAKVPVAFGIPDIEVVAPVELVSAKPEGRVPEAILQLNGPGRVPVADKVSL